MALLGGMSASEAIRGKLVLECGWGGGGYFRWKGIMGGVGYLCCYQWED